MSTLSPKKQGPEKPGGRGKSARTRGWLGPWTSRQTWARAPSLAAQFVQLEWQLWRQVISERRRMILGSLLGVCAAVVALFPFDRTLLQHIQSGSGVVHFWAGWLSEFGKFEYSTLLVCLAIGAAGVYLDRKPLRRAARAAFTAGLVAGILVNVLRPGLGRARPNSGIEDGFYLFELHNRFHSFPSGHAASTTATAAAISVLLPSVGIPFLGIAGLVSWSRLERNQHHLSDVIAGIYLGGIIGWIAGLAARKRTRLTTQSSAP